MAALFESLAVTGSRKADGSANASGRAWFYRPGTQTKATVYGDAAQSAPISNPVTLNAGGKATVYFAGQVDVFLETSAGLPISTLTLAERAERVEVQNAGFTGLLPSGSQGAGGATDLNTVLSSIAASVGGLDGLVKEYTNATGRKVVDKFREILVSVKDYGAKGDGLADDSTGIQASANEVARLGGGILYFPPGTYNFGTQPSFSASNITVRGAGMASTILRATSTGVSGLVMTGSSTTTIEDLWLTCTGSNSNSGITSGTGTIRISRVKITNFTLGVSVSGAAPGPITVRDSIITAVAGVTAACVSISASTLGAVGSTVSSSLLSAASGNCITVAGIVNNVTIGPGNVFAAGAPLLADNSSGNVTNIAFFGNDTTNAGDYAVNGASPVVSQFANGHDGYNDIVVSAGSWTPNWRKGTVIEVGGISTGAAYTTNAPTPTPRADTKGLFITLIFSNQSGAPITGWGLNAIYHLVGAAGPSLVDTHRTAITFWWDCNVSVWREVCRADTT